MMRLLRASTGTLSLTPFSRSKKLGPPNRASSQRRTTRPVSCKMSSDSMDPSPSLTPTHSLTLPAQPREPVQIVAAPGVSDSNFRSAVESYLFKRWLKNLQSETGILAKGVATLRRVLIQGVDMFENRIGFVKFEADIYDKETGRKLAGIVFARGPAVAVLILLDSEGETYAVLTEQARVPVGRFVLELPAGMLDEDQGDFVGTAAREVQEEIGIRLNLEDMVDLTAFLDPSGGCRVIPSPGGCDEEIGIFLYRGNVDKQIIEKLQGRQTGLPEGSELIRVRVLPYEKLWRATGDAKVLMAIALYEMAKHQGLLPPLKSRPVS